MSKRMLIVPGLIAAVLLGACASDSKKAEAAPAATTKTVAAKSVNANCPISGKPVDGTDTVSYKDKTVGFCCDGCPAKWTKMSDADKDAKLAAATKK